MARRALPIAGLAVAGLLLALGAGHARSERRPVGTVKGTVVDAATGKALVGAAVAAGGRRATTGADGRYTLTLPPGTYTVTCTHPAYRKATRNGVKVEASATVTVDFRLSPRAADREEAAEEEERAEPAREGRRRKQVMKARRRRPPPMRRPAPMMDALNGAGAPAALSPPAPTVAAPSAQIAVGDAPPADFEREGYSPIRENPFLAVRQEPLSTFSIDVDTAAYANVRRFIDQSRLPPKDAVRIEELINYFPYRYPEPEGPHPFAVHTETSVAPWSPNHRLVRIGIQGRRVDTSDLPPSNLVFLLDVSGSMNAPNKLPLLKAAFKLLVNQLRTQDRVAIVVYAGAAGLVLPSTPGSDKKTILDALDRLRAGGSTAGGAGIRLAYQVARENFLEGGNNRVILATDGDFNVGASSDAEMVRLIEEQRKHGVFLTVLGFGTGNYQDAKMQQIADHGNGNHAYIDSILEAKKVLVSEMGGTLLTIAKDVKIQIEFNPAKVKAYRLIGYENRLLRNQDFNDDTKDAGELGAGHSVTALYELIPAGSDEPVPGVDELKYQRTEISPTAEASDELMTVKLRYKQPDGEKSQLIVHPVIDAHRPLAETSDDFRFASAVAEFGLLLRDSAHKGQASFDAVIERARAARGDDPEGYRHDFVRLVEKAKLLASTGAR